MKNYEINMTRGRIFPKMLAFALPLMLTGILQLLFNAADIIVVGKFAGDDSLAAVGSTSSLVNLFINIFMGLSIGANVLVSIAYGAKDYKRVHRIVQTSIVTSLFLGIVMAVFGIILAEPILGLMKTPSNVLSKAALYLKIYFLGVPALLIFNYASAILRAVGDTKRPLYFLSIGGVINVILNLIFTIKFRMDVAGVAIATVVSEYISMALIIFCLIRTKAEYKYDIKEFKIYKKELVGMVKIGIPAAIQSSLFSFSNMIIQSSINTFGSIVVAGSTVATSIEGFIYTSMNSVYSATLSFTGQNFGAGEHKRLNTVLFSGLAIVSVIGISMCLVSLALSDELFGIFTNSAEVIKAAKIRASVILPTYFLCGIMEVFVGSVRGHGYSLLPTFISAVGILAARLTWVFTVFAWYNDIRLLYMAWGVSYIIVVAAFIVSYIFIRRKVMKLDLRSKQVGFN